MNFSDIIQKGEEYAKNPIISGGIMILVILFSGLVVPAINLENTLFTHPLLKIFIIIGILVVKKYSTLGALILSVLFVLFMQCINKANLSNLSQRLQNSMDNAYREVVAKEHQEHQEQQEQQSQQAHQDSDLGAYTNDLVHELKLGSAL